MTGHPESAPTAPVVAYDARGVRVRVLRLALTATASTDEWRALVKDARMVEKTLETGTDVVPTAELTALPAMLAPPSVYFVGTVTPIENAGDEATAQWVLTWFGIPDGGDPPQPLVEASERVGGYPVAVEALCRHWPSGARSVQARTEAVYEVDASRYEPAVTMPSGPESTKLGSVTLTKSSVAVGLHLAPPVNGIFHVSLTLPSDAYPRVILFGLGEAPIVVQSGLFEAVEAATWKGLATVLKEKSSDA